MREYKKNICVSDSNRLTEKAFKQSITISFIGILLCMVALCSVTWAWFSAEISSSSNDIIDSFVNAIYLFDDYLVITFNYKEGTKTITFAEIEEAFGSDLSSLTAPKTTSFDKKNLVVFLAFI